jgi:hypothetical protein
MQLTGAQARLEQALSPHKVQHQPLMGLTNRISFEVLVIRLTGET